MGWASVARGLMEKGGNNMNCKRILFGSMAFIFSSVLAVPAQSQEDIRIGIGIDAAYTAMYIAKQERLFEKHGVAVTLEQFAAGGLGVDAVVAGLNQMGSSSEPTTMIRMARADIRTVAVLNESRTYLKVVAREGIASPLELRKLGLLKGSVGEYVAQLMIQRFNLDPSTLELVQIEPPEAPALLVRGDIDGFLFWEPWPTYGQQQGGNVILTNGDVGYVDGIWLSVAGEWLEGNQAKVQSVLAALDEACQIANADPEKAVAAVVAEIKLDAALARNLIEQRECKVRDFTDADMAAYGQISQFLLDRNIIAEMIDLDVAVERGFFKP